MQENNTYNAGLYSEPEELTTCPLCVGHDNWIIQTISKHIIADDPLSGRSQCISINESTHLWIVISGLEVVERGLSVLGLAVEEYCADFRTLVPRQGIIDPCWGTNLCCGSNAAQLSFFRSV